MLLLKGGNIKSTKSTIHHFRLFRSATDLMITRLFMTIVHHPPWLLLLPLSTAMRFRRTHLHTNH